MKIETYHQAYDHLSACAREASDMKQFEIVEMIQDARAKLHRAWDRMVELEQENHAEPLSKDPHP